MCICGLYVKKDICEKKIKAKKETMYVQKQEEPYFCRAWHHFFSLFLLLLHSPPLLFQFATIHLPTYILNIYITFFYPAFRPPPLPPPAL